MHRLVGASRWGFALAVAMSIWAMSADRAQARDALPGHHIYCIRGLLNVMSLGMDEICDKLSKMGYSASTHNHAVWSSLAAEAAENYNAGRKRTIILLGHSYGADAVASITEKLGTVGVPVKLAVELDCLWETTASGRVDRFINLYIPGSGKRVNKGANFKGSLQNIDVSKSQVGHLSIHYDPAIQARVIQYVRQATARPAQPPAPAASSSATSDARTASASAKPAGKN
jgi:hypothetical protein